MHAEPAGFPRSFVADATDIAAVLEARQARLVLGWTRRVFVIGIPTLLVAAMVTAIFLPCCVMRFPRRSQQSEAKGNLKALYIQMQSWFADHDRYSDRFTEIGFEPKGQRLRYRYVVTGADREYRGWAFGVADAVAGDLWVTDQDNRLVNVDTCCEEAR